MLARPDADSFRILPWPEGESVGRMLCDVTYPDGAPFEGDPRHVLKRNLARAGEMGYSLVAGPEVEFFLSRSATSFEPLDRGGYFDLTPAEVADDVRKRAASALDALGVRVEMIHHEDAPSQHEVVLAADDALRTADGVMTLRLVMKEAAQEAGLHASFMPKPEAGIQGSGMH